MFPRLRDVMVLTILWWPYVVLTYHSATISRSLYMKQMDKKERAEVRLQKHIARENSMGRSNAAVVSAATKRGTIENEIEMLQTEESDEIYTKTWVDPAGVESDQPLSATKQEYISIVSYNVLGPLHGESSKHSYADTKVVMWNRRRDKLTEELRHINADVLCLQEVSEKALRETYIPGLKHIGLECSGFAPMKTLGRVRGKYAHKSVGCAIFTRKSKFEVLASKRVYLKDFFPVNECFSHQFCVDMMSKWNAMVMTLLNDTTTNKTLIVVNTHLFWNPARTDIKSAQAFALTQALTAFIKDVYDDNNVGTTCSNEKLAIVLCGDLNSFPECSSEDGMLGRPSGVFKLLETGELTAEHPEHPDAWHNSMGVGYPNPRLGSLKSKYTVRNAYQTSEFVNRRPMFTTKTDDFQGWIDHVFINDGINVEQVLSPPIYMGDLDASRKARKFKPIPNRNFPSDHVPLGVVVSIK